MYEVEKKNLFFVVVLFSLILLPLTSAVTLDSGTVLNTTISNSSMTFVGCSVTTTNATVFTDAIYIHNPQIVGVSNLTYFIDNPIIWNTANTNVDCTDFIATFGTALSIADAGTHQMCLGFAGGVSEIAGMIVKIFMVLGAVMIISIVVFLGMKLKDLEAGAMSSGNYDDVMKVIIPAVMGVAFLIFVIIMTMIGLSVLCP